MNRLRRCFARESSGSGRYGFPGLKQEGDWVFTASALRRMWRFKWRDIGESKFMLLREMRATRNWRWNWARYGPEERLTRSEEHTSELQSHHELVCRLL